MNQEQREHMDRQEEQQVRATAQQTAQQLAADRKQRTIHNENFLAELRNAGLDSETFGWLQEEYPDWFADARAVTNRGDDWDTRADLQMQSKRERAVAQGRPGRLLRNRPFLLATMQGAETPQLDAYDAPDIPGSREYWEPRVKRQETTTDPITSEERERIYGAAEVAADLMALSRNGAGLESVSTVKTESSIRRQEQDETTAEKAGRLVG